MIIVDASVLTNALADDSKLGLACQAELDRDAHWAGPETLIVETLAAVRGRLLGGKIAKQRADSAIDALADSAIDLISTVALVHRMWQLRDNVSAYDAAYVAAAEALGCALVTADARLARANGINCPVRLVLSTD